MSSRGNSKSRLAAAALQLLMERGLRGVGGKAVAEAAGVSRMTVHRHFASKEALVEAALGRVAHVFEEAIEVPERDQPPAAPERDQPPAAPEGDLDQTVARLGEAIARLPRGDLPTRLAEVRAAYPDLHRRFLAARRRALDALLDKIFREGGAVLRLRSDLNRQVAEAFVRESLANLFAPNPALLGRGVEPAEIFRTVKEIILYGIVERPTEPDPSAQPRKGAKR